MEATRDGVDRGDRSRISIEATRLPNSHKTHAIHGDPPWSLFALAVRLPRAPLSAPRAPPVALTATATSCEALLRATFEGVG